MWGPMLLRCFIFAALFVGFAGAPAYADLVLQPEYLEDPAKTLRPQEVMAGGKALPWKSLEGRRASFGYTKSRYWFRFRMPSEGEDLADRVVILTIPSVYVARAELFMQSGGEISMRSVTGMGVPISQRDPGYLTAGGHSFRLPNPRPADAVFYLSAESDFPLSVNLQMRLAQDFLSLQLQKQLVVGIFLGALVLAFLFNGFLAFALNSRLYFYYFLFVGSIAFLMMGHEGLTVQFLWPEWPWWALREMHISGGLTLLFYALFVRKFLDSRAIMPFLDKLMIFFVTVSSVRSVWLLFQSSQFIEMAGEYSIVLVNLTALAMAAVGLWKGVRSARLFLFSSLAYNIASALFILQETNLIWIGSVMQYAIHAGLLVEVILLSFALADRIRVTTRDLQDSNTQLDLEIKERKLAEGKLERQRMDMVHSEKMSALGRMAGGIAHEINNPLAIIQGNASLLGSVSRQGEANWEKVQEIATVIEQTTGRISRIMKSMRTLARNSQNDPMERVPASSIFADTLTLCQERYQQKAIRLEMPVLTEEVFLLCRSAEICQVLVNLLNNSFDAVENSEEKWVVVGLLEEKDRILISVTDSGSGIPESSRDRIQEPFFTTKEVGRGTGLGLSISRTIMSNHRGSLWLEESSANTKFMIALPKTK